MTQVPMESYKEKKEEGKYDSTSIKLKYDAPSYPEVQGPFW